MAQRPLQPAAPPPPEFEDRLPNRPEAGGISPDSRVLSKATARQLTNFVDALDPRYGACDLISPIETRVRHRGPAAARRLWFWLGWLALEPVVFLHERRRFWRLPREARERAVERWRTSRWTLRRHGYAELRVWVEDAAREAGLSDAGDQSSDGA